MRAICMDGQKAFSERDIASYTSASGASMFHSVVQS